MDVIGFVDVFVKDKSISEHYRSNIMHDLQELKPLFRQYNLPDPERLTLDIVESKLEELSGAVEDIETQLEERSEPLEWMPEEEFYAWRTRAYGARHVKTKQIEVLEILAERLKQDVTKAVANPYASHPLAEEVRQREAREREERLAKAGYRLPSQGRSAAPVRYFNPSNPAEVEEFSSARKKTAERIKVDAAPAKVLTRGAKSAEQELSEAVTHLKKCLRLMEKMIKDEEIALFLEEVKIISNAREYLKKHLDTVE